MNEPLRQLVPAKPPERNAWFPPLRGSRESTPVPEPASLAASENVTRIHKKSDGSPASRIKKNWAPRGSSRCKLAVEVGVEAVTHLTAETCGCGGGYECT